MSWLVVVVTAYVLGSVPFSYLVVKARTGQDIRSAGSGNVGTTNALRVAGKGAALLVLICDVGKGVAAVLVSQRLTGSTAVGGAAAVAAVLGHVRPIFLGSGGGKGGATGFGALVALAPAVGAVCVVLLVIVVAWTRYVSVGTMVTAVAWPGAVLLGQQLGWVRDRSAWLPLAGAAIAAVILFRHRGNLRRLRAGCEPRVGQRWRWSPDPADPTPRS